MTTNKKPTTSPKTLRVNDNDWIKLLEIAALNDTNACQVIRKLIKEYISSNS